MEVARWKETLGIISKRWNEVVECDDSMWDGRLDLGWTDCRHYDESYSCQCFLIRRQ